MARNQATEEVIGTTTVKPSNTSAPENNTTADDRNFIAKFYTNADGSVKIMPIVGTLATLAIGFVLVKKFVFKK